MFTHLHVHTEYSLLDGMCRIPQLIARTRELGMDSLAITDHGSLYGVIDFYLAAKEAGIKPILGCEIYLAQDHTRRDATNKNSEHLILLAKNAQGYSNLLKLVTAAHLEGFYYKPRVDKELLKQYHEGLIALTACLHGEIPQLILQGRLAEAKATAAWYKDIFGDFYLEIQRHPIPELAQINEVLLSISKELDIPIVASNDVHYIAREDASIHELLLCIQTNTSIYDEKRMKLAGDYFYLKSPQEMAELFADLPEALENTSRIAQMCQLELEFSRLHLPQVELPQAKTADSYLAELCWQGLKQRYPQATPQIEQRLAYELEVIAQTQFANYFLVVWDLMSFVRQQKILFGVRGSAAASLVLYCLGITSIDPLAHNLVFERFLNVERKEMPDIDLDFQDDRRDEVISYVTQKYRPDHVAQIITFGTLGARAALRDTGRALGIPYSHVDRIARLVPFGPGVTLDRALKENEELRTIYADDSVARQLVDSAKRLEGTARHASTHAAGVVISKEPLTQYLPLQRAGKGDQQATMTQFSMENVARLGLLKMDFLGLANLTILGKAKELIQQTPGQEIDLQNLPLDDSKTYELLSSGETSGVFQLEGTGMRRYIRELKPSTFSDIAAMIALYRPGPMEHIPTFIKAKHGLEPITYPDPALAGILEETYGVIVYQDQVLLIVRAFAGYTLGQADIFRKAMGKKIPEVMRRERDNFVAGAKRKGFSTEVAQQVFQLIEPFAGYAFNKAHSVSYAMIAYQTAYLKANYPVEFMTAFLITHAGEIEKVPSAIAECRRLGITVLPPDINRSELNFSIERDVTNLAIRFGLAAIKNVGAGAVEPILQARKQGGSFKSADDLCKRADLRGINKRVMESLIKAGALDSVGNRGALLQASDRIVGLAQREQKLRETGQATMFDLWGAAVPVPLPTIELVDVDLPLKEKLAWEKELLGVYLSEHPFSRAAQKLASVTDVLCGQIDNEMAGRRVVVAGMVSSVQQLTTKDRRPFATAELEDLNGSIEVTVWPEVYKDTKELWEEGNILLVAGKVKVRDDHPQLVCEQAKLYQLEAAAKGQIPPTVEAQPKSNNLAPGTADKGAVMGDETPHNNQISPLPPGRKRGGEAFQYPPSLKRRLIINMAQTESQEEDIERLRSILDILTRYPGPDDVQLAIVQGEEVTKMEMPGITTGYCAELREKLTEVVDSRDISLSEEVGHN